MPAKSKPHPLFKRQFPSDKTRLLAYQLPGKSVLGSFSQNPFEKSNPFVLLTFLPVFCY
jgi:hypothetical protein